MDNSAKVAECLTQLGAAWRSDWSDFDGRTLRDQLNELATYLKEGGAFDTERWKVDTGICPVEGGWSSNCLDHTGYECNHVKEYYENMEKEQLTNG